MHGEHVHSNEIMYLSDGSDESGIADFTKKLKYAGETLSSVTSVTQIAGPGTLTLSAGTINSSGDVTVGSITVAQNKGVQYSVDARGCKGGKYKVRVTAVTSTGQVVTLDCRVEVCA